MSIIGTVATACRRDMSSSRKRVTGLWSRRGCRYHTARTRNYPHRRRIPRRACHRRVRHGGIRAWSDRRRNTFSRRRGVRNHVKLRSSKVNRWYIYAVANSQTSMILFRGHYETIQFVVLNIFLVQFFTFLVIARDPIMVLICQNNWPTRVKKYRGNRKITAGDKHRI
jgi:hypothetical protein